jgi:mRNA-degrading endonuclease HigB of HigAB toxin-antitoxin module
MRVIAKRTLREFWESTPKYADAEDPLRRGIERLNRQSGSHLLILKNNIAMRVSSKIIGLYLMSQVINID